MPEEAKLYDVVVIGSGSGTTAVNQAIRHGLTVALVERGPVGGTCLNLGCIPSKMLIFPADRVAEIEEAAKLGVYSEILRVDFRRIMERMRKSVSSSHEGMRRALQETKELDFYEGEGHFTGDYTLEVNGKLIRGNRIFIASGSRPLIPPIRGLGEVDYLTNETLLDLVERPKSIIVIGGGYIAAEYSHFFASMGAEVTVLERLPRLLATEEPEISSVLENKMAERMDVYTNTECTEVSAGGEGIVAVARNTESGSISEFTAERILIATGRRSNADILQVANTGVEVDERGYVKVNEYMETSKPGIWALGDILGRHMFKHVANEEAYVAAHNAFHDEKITMDYRAVPHAVFSYPQVASVGMTEAEAREKHDVLVGVAHYDDVAKGDAMLERDGFAKAIVEEGTYHILGFHIIGPYAPILIQEVINGMAHDGTVGTVGYPMHIHPAMPELIQAALSHLHSPEGHVHEH